MMKMGYLSKNYYEMRYTVSHAAIDGSGTATDLTPHVSFFLDISPEEAHEKIKARGNEAEIKTITLDFLKHLDEAYRGFWAEDMHNKGCTVMNVDPVSLKHLFLYLYTKISRETLPLILLIFLTSEKMTSSDTRIADGTTSTRSSFL
jgi:deoxyadenosine/deoxycytidine kinase